MKKRLLLTIPVLLIGHWALAIVFVNAAATGANDGSSWANAYTHLDTALLNFDPIVDGAVWVAKGTYKPGDGTNRNASFSIRGSVYGGFNGTETKLGDRDPKLNETILSGDLLGNDQSTVDLNGADRSDNVYSVVQMLGNGLLDGLIIEGGNAEATSGAYTQTDAGAIYISSTVNATVNNCVIRNNAGTFNGAIVFYRSYQSSNCFFTLTNCAFYNNVSPNSLIGTRSTTRAATRTTEVRMVNNLFYENKVDQNNNSSLIAANSYMIGNRSDGHKHFLIFHNTFVNNQLKNSASVINFFRRTSSGVGSSLVTNKLEVVGNIFWNNGVKTALKYQAGVANATPITSIYCFNNVLHQSDSLKEDSLNTLSGYIEANEYGKDPLFTNAANRDFTITDCNSAANDKNNFIFNGGSSLFVRDFYGNPRLVGINYDAGHAEVQTRLTGITVQQVGTQLVATAGQSAYRWYDLNSGNPVPLPTDTTNTLSPTQDGRYAVAIRGLNGCKDFFPVNYCGSVVVSISAAGDSLVATGSKDFQWYFKGKKIDGARSTTYRPTQNGVYTCESWDSQNPNGCKAKADKKWCGTWGPVAITHRNDTLFAPSGYTDYQWNLNGSAITGATDSVWVPGTTEGNYSITVKDSVDCSRTSKDLSFKLVGTLESGNDPATIVVFPNPVSERLYLQLGSIPVTQIQLVTVTGSIKRNYTSIPQSIEVSDLPPGVYFLSIKSTTDLWSRKVIVQ